jgi:hypothetical protein
MELQARRVQQGFKRQAMTELTGAPKEQAKRERNVLNGVQYTNQNKGAVQRMDSM